MRILQGGKTNVIKQTQKRCAVLFAIVLALIILTTYLYIQANNVRELEPFEQRRETFEEVAELVLAKAQGDDRICFFPSNNDEVLLYEDENDGAQIAKSGKKLLIDSNMLKDIRSFSDRAFI